MSFHPEVPEEQLHYRGRTNEDPHKSGHTVESRALVAILGLLPGRKKYKPAVKLTALTLLTDLVRQGCASRGADQVLGGSFSFNMFSSTSGDWETVRLSWTAEGMTAGLAGLADRNPAAAAVWQRLIDSGWSQKKITSSLELASLWDLLFYAVYCKHNSTMCKAWQEFCLPMWPKLIFHCGSLVELHGSHLAEQPPQPLPLLKTQKGNTKRIPKINKLLLLQRMEKQKRHRAEVMKTHLDLTSSDAMLIKSEMLICVSQYARKVAESFANTYQVQVSWDESTYDCETLVCIAYDYQQNLAAYLPLQNVQPVQSCELDPAIQQLARDEKITRVDGFNSMRALSHAMKSIGLPLSVFAKPQDMHLGPLKATEVRVCVQGSFFIYDQLTTSTVRQLPEGLDLQTVPMLLSMSDQGPLNAPGLDHLQFHLGMLILPCYDCYHRCWNDIKASLRSAPGSLFRTLLEYSLVYNLNYGPCGSKAWFSKKVQYAREFLMKNSPHEEPFLSYMPYVCREMGISEAETAEERQQLWDSISSMESLRLHGPLVKLTPFLL